MQFSILASGSSGNSTFIKSGKTGILVDSGLSCKKIEEALLQIDISLADLTAIIITHEHIDHVTGLGIMARKLKIPIHLTYATYQNLPKSIGVLPEENCTFFAANQSFEIGELNIESMPISHDAADPVCFKISDSSDMLAIVTDLGYMPERIIKRLQGVHTLILESNHDVEMLMMGKYPWNLKQRILSDSGHLSNQSAGEALARIIKGEGERVYLAHLSQKNNMPELAHITVSNILTELGCIPGADFTLDVADPYQATALFPVNNRSLASLFGSN